MTARYTATLTALLLLGLARVVHAQQTADSLQHARVHDERMITGDTVKLHRDVAIRDSVRTVLDRDQAASVADAKQLDSLKLALDKARKATPRDTAAINRNLATVKRLQAKHDREFDKANREKKRLDFQEKTVKRESQAAIGAHHDVRSDHPESKKTTGSSGNG